ncbi:RNA polymerase sigma factor [Terrimonas alba]|uniref:RNA polymerase sigma factor n=1 Tax=Terrimonas alba TaxID=3349636 RepID=UPI0035F3DDB0
MSLRPSHIAEAHILSFQQGEERGFDYYFRQWYPSLCFFANRYIQQPQAAEEIVSDAYLKVWKRHAQFTNEKVLRSYLYTTVRNGCLSWLEKEKKIVIPPTTAPDKTMLEHMIHAEVMQDIYRHMQALPHQCKTVFTRLYIDGKSVKETAEEMNLSVSTVKTQKARALAYIKGKLRPLLLLLLLYPFINA